jgi:DNA-directed RNA polymerase subunit RPC12/RpoP
MLQLAGIFGIHNGGLSLAVTLLVILLVIIWLTLIYWTFADARRRVDDPLLVACATVVAIVPFLGTAIYAIIRPPEYIDDVRERDLAIQASEAQIAGTGILTCPYCDREVERDFVRCPHCLHKLKEPCANCGRPLDPSWQICPYCEQRVAAAPAQSRRGRRSAPQRPASSAGPSEMPPPREGPGSGPTPRESPSSRVTPRESPSSRVAPRRRSTRLSSRDDSDLI